MGLYEIQVLDSYENKTYADGEAAAVYGQYPPLVNSSRPPGQWQTYDIVFHGPRFDKDGKLLRPARATVFYNGVLAQDNVELSGPTAHGKRPPYEAQPEKLPLAIQDHGNPFATAIFGFGTESSRRQALIFRRILHPSDYSKNESALEFARVVVEAREDWA